MKIIYAATDSDVIHANGAPNLYARIPDTIDIWKTTKAIKVVFRKIEKSNNISEILYFQKKNKRRCTSKKQKAVNAMESYL